jgi:hypothetical protein
MAESHVIPGQVYRHWKKQDRYEVLCIATHTEEEQRPEWKTLVVYRRLYDGTIWARPLSMFTGTVPKDGGSVPRFMLDDTYGKGSSGDEKAQGGR